MKDNQSLKSSTILLNQHPQKRESIYHLLSTEHPDEKKAHDLVARAKAFINKQQYDYANRILDKVISCYPTHPDALEQLAYVQHITGNHAAAAYTLSRLCLIRPDSPNLLHGLAICMARSNQMHAALCALERAIYLRPDLPEYQELLAALYGTANLESLSRIWGSRTARMLPVVTRKAPQKEHLRILCLETMSSGGVRYNSQADYIYIAEGHNNLAGTLDKKHITTHTLRVDGLKETPGLASSLPAIDVIYNSITDPDRCSKALAQAATLVDQLKIPVLNHPSSVLQTGRTATQHILKNHSSIVVPEAVLLKDQVGDVTAAIEDTAQKKQLGSKFILRIAGMHGGQHMWLYDEWKKDAVPIREKVDIYLIKYFDVGFKDSRCPDKTLFRKYRAMMVGKELFPVHMFVADHFNVHKNNHDKLVKHNPWIIHEEHRYITSPAEYFAHGQWSHLRDAIASMDLEYTGVDFAPLTDGRFIVFETNPGMRNWLHELPRNDQVQHSWETITLAVHDLLCSKAQKKPWEYSLYHNK